MRNEKYSAFHAVLDKKEEKTRIKISDKNMGSIESVQLGILHKKLRLGDSCWGGGGAKPLS